VPATDVLTESNVEPDRSVPFRDTRKWRNELHGIRGVAIFLVVAFHIFGNGRVSGGIDIFLAITGFLAVPSLYRRAMAGGGFIPLMSRFGGLARRLLVPLVPVLVFIAIVGSLILPVSFQPQMFTELRASALFAENIELVRSQLAYDAAGPETSALQHLWSTSIQVQFHILMPFVFMLLTIPMVKNKRDPRRALIIILAILSVGSFAYAWWNQGVYQQANYFSSISRLWELTLPGILGLTVSNFKLNNTTRATLSWLGLLMILSTGFIFDGASVFPGPQALLPVGGLLLFLTAGKTYTKWGADNVVQLAPVKFLADISYSLYLWHWPVIIFYLNYFARPNLGAIDALIVFTISIALGTMGKKLFEDRVASMQLLKNNNIAVLLAVIVMLTSAGVFHWRIQASEKATEKLAASYRDAITEDLYPGARALSDDVQVELVKPIPAPDLALTELPDVYSFPPGNSDKYDKCTLSVYTEQTFPTTCEFGNDNAQKTVVLTGGSHVGHWWEAFEDMARDYNWKLILMERGACQLGLDQDIHEPQLNILEPCIEWNREAIDYIRDVIQPDLVVTLGTSLQYDQIERINRSQEAAWQELGDIPLLLLRDNPRLDVTPTECLLEEANINDPSTYAQCSLNLDGYELSPEYDHAPIKEHPENSYYVNTNEILTVNGEYPPTIGNVLVWRDRSHLTNLFAKSARNFFEQALQDFMPELLE
jgi:peptidoglycan/LPS O-acetylase OafA/YrhL